MATEHEGHRSIVLPAPVPARTTRQGYVGLPAPNST